MTRRRWPLRRRLIALVAAVAATVIVAGTIVSHAALRGSLLGQVDEQLIEAARHGASIIGVTEPGSPSRQGRRPRGDTDTAVLNGPGQQVGTVLYVEVDGAGASGIVRSDFTLGTLTVRQIHDLLKAPLDGEPHTVELDGLGNYRVLGWQTGNDLLITGLSLQEVDRTLATYSWQQGLLGLAGVVLVAALAGWLIRRELRPLQQVAATAREVADTPLDRGEVRLELRTPFADPDTEVGQVGSALNTLLGHVESSLDARHHSEQRLRQFVADASHELRTPLASISGYTELLRTRESLDATDRTTYLSRIASESARMSTLVEELLLLARLDAGRALEAKPVDLTRVVADAVLDARAAGTDHQWRLDLPTDESGEPAELMVTGDEARLRQVLANLLANVRTHTPPGTTAVTSVRRDGDEIVVQVADDGPGIPASLRERVFDRFVRGDASRQRAKGSTGLGLAIARAVVESHRGTISVRPGYPGTTVEVRLPAG